MMPRKLAPQRLDQREGALRLGLVQTAQPLARMQVEADRKADREQAIDCGVELGPVARDSAGALNAAIRRSGVTGRRIWVKPRRCSAASVAGSGRRVALPSSQPGRLKPRASAARRCAGTVVWPRNAQSADGACARALAAERRQRGAEQQACKRAPSWPVARAQQQIGGVRICRQIPIGEPARLQRHAICPFQPVACIQPGARRFLPETKSNNPPEVLISPTLESLARLRRQNALLGRRSHADPEDVGPLRH